jgi:putative transposase
MIKRQAFKYEIELNGKQLKFCRKSAGCCRFIYNKALAIQKENHVAGDKFINYVAMAKQLTDWRRDENFYWLKEAPYHALQYTLKALDNAYQKFFNAKAAFPRFKKKGCGDKFHFPDKNQIKLDQINSRICLPKLGWIRYRNSREVIGEVRNVTVSCIGDRWFVSIQTECEIESPIQKSKTAIGIDVGIVQFATMNDGSFIKPLNSFEKHQECLAKAQKKLSKKVKFSKNWEKAKAKIQKIHTRIANVRKDFLHKITTAISKNHALVCIEDLKVKQMSKSVSGTVEDPGKEVKRKSMLNRKILDQGWGEFRRQLEYKMEWNGGVLVVVPPQYTSTKCPDCNHITAENRKSRALFKCVSCNYENHADIVGAINILERGYRLLACGE